jgi:hypothetical protein
MVRLNLQFDLIGRRDFMCAWRQLDGEVVMKEWTLLIERGGRGSPGLDSTGQEQCDEVEGKRSCPDIHQEAF